MKIKNLVESLRARLNIKSGEGKLAFLLFSYFFLITCPHTIIKALRTTDLLVKMGVGALPLAYLSAAVVTGLVVLLHARIQFKVSIQVLIISSLVFFALSGLLLQLVFQTRYGRTSALLPYIYWVWASILIIVLMTHFWMTVNGILNPREAKRLIGLVSSGGILGGVVGGFLAGFLTRGNLAVLLLPLACLFLFACVFVVRTIFRFQQKQLSAPLRRPAGKQQPGTPKVGFKDSWDAVRKNSYLVLIAAVVSIGVIVSTLIEFQFFSATDAHYTNAKDIQAFLGFFFAFLTIFAFFFNAFLTGNLLKKLQMKSLLVTPVILFLGSLVVLVSPFALLPAIFIKGSDESLAFSLNQSTREILYIPIFSDLKFKVKPFIDMFICRFAKVVAALSLLVFALLLDKEVKYLTPVFDPGLAKNLSWIIIAFLIPWTVFALKIGKMYLKAIVENIPRMRDRGDRTVTEQLDVDYIKQVFDMVDSRNRSAVLYAMNLFDLLEQNKLTPEIKEMISEKSGEVKGSSLSGLFDAEGAAGFQETADEISRADLVTNIREIMSMDAYQQLIKLHAEKVFEESKKSEIEKMELAKAIGLMPPDAPLVENLGKLISDDSPDVSGYAIKSAARLLKVEHIPAIIQKLGNPLTREDAISALHKYGRPAINALEKYLTDKNRDLASRTAAVEVLARIGSQEAAGILAKELEQEDRDLDSSVIDALDRIRSEKAGVRFPAQHVQRKIYSLIQAYCREFLDLQQLGPGDKNAERRRQLERHLEISLADIFKLLGLSYPHEDILKAWQNLQTQSRNSVAFAIELLDNTLKKEMKDLILPLVEDMPPSERLKKFKKILK
jgi:AAA family ATP:ADP antiporter